MHIAPQGHVDGAISTHDFHTEGQGTVDVAKHPHGPRQAVSLPHGAAGCEEDAPGSATGATAAALEVCRKLPRISSPVVSRHFLRGYIEQIIY